MSHEGRRPNMEDFTLYTKNARISILKNLTYLWKLPTRLRRLRDHDEEPKSRLADQQISKSFQSSQRKDEKAPKKNLGKLNIRPSREDHDEARNQRSNECSALLKKGLANLYLWLSEGYLNAKEL